MTLGSPGSRPSPTNVGRHSVMAAVGCMAIRSDRQVQGNTIKGSRTRHRPSADSRPARVLAAKQSLALAAVAGRPHWNLEPLEALRVAYFAPNGLYLEPSVTKFWPPAGRPIEVGTQSKAPDRAIATSCAAPDGLGLPTRGPCVQAIGRQPHRAQDGAPIYCERHDPEYTTLYRLVQRHSASVIAHTKTNTGSSRHASSRTNSTPSSNGASWPTAS